MEPVRVIVLKLRAARERNGSALAVNASKVEPYQREDGALAHRVTRSNWWSLTKTGGRWIGLMATSRLLVTYPKVSELIDGSLVSFGDSHASTLTHRHRLRD